MSNKYFPRQDNQMNPEKSQPYWSVDGTAAANGPQTTDRKTKYLHFGWFVVTMREQKRIK